MSALLKLSYSDTHVNELAILIMGDIILVISFVLLIVSYAGIVSSILKVPLLEVSVKPFLPVVPTCLWYHCSMGQSSDNSTLKETFMTMMNTVVTLMLNPFIYSLWNRDMKMILARLLCNKKILLCL